MADRKPWDSLSPTYRERLSRGGITPAMHARGESIRAARGHAHTPEHPKDAENKAIQYQEWYQNRRNLIRRLNQRKEQIFGSSHKFRPANSRRLTAEGFGDNFPSNQMLRWAINADEDELMEAVSSGDESYSFLWYH